MCVRVRGQKGQDDGNKRKKGGVENHGDAQKVLIGLFAVNFSFCFMTMAATNRHKPPIACTLPPAAHILGEAQDVREHAGGRHFPTFASVSGRGSA